jgi:hypothetical protein
MSTWTEGQSDRLLAELTPEERNGGVAYAADGIMAARAPTTFPGVTLVPPWDALLAFIDRAPTANWAHPARYLLLRRDGHEVLSREVRFPPFGSGEEIRWHVAYKAPTVPDAALAVPR